MSKASILAPVEITSSMLVSSTVAETVALWNPATVYGIGAEVRSPITNKSYLGQLAGNTNKDPSDIDNRAGTTIWWVETESSNRWKLFDNRISSQTVDVTSFTYVLRPGIFNCIYLAGLDAIFLSISIKDSPGGTVVFSTTSTLEGSSPADYYEFFYDRFRPKKDYIVFDLVPYPDPEVTITLSANTGNKVYCGLMSVGDLKPLGETQFNATVKPKTSSYIKINDFLEAEIVKRKSAKDMDFTCYLDHSESDSVLQTLNDFLDVPCLVVGSTDDTYEGLRAYGLVSSTLTYDSHNIDFLKVSVNGLI